MKIQEIFKRKDGTVVGYSGVGNDFLWQQMDLSNSALRIYIYFIWQVNSAKVRSPKIKVTISSLCYQTGIKTKEIIENGITELVEKGWIEWIEPQLNNENIYTINPERHKPNMALIKWRTERSQKQSENSKKLLVEGKLVRGENGRFQKKEKLEVLENDVF